MSDDPHCSCVEWRAPVKIAGGFTSHGVPTEDHWSTAEDCACLCDYCLAGMHARARRQRHNAVVFGNQLARGDRHDWLTRLGFPPRRPRGWRRATTETFGYTRAGRHGGPRMAVRVAEADPEDT